MEGNTNEKHHLSEFLNTPTAKKEMTKCMAKKIYLDAGHGGNDPGAVGYVVELLKDNAAKQRKCKLPQHPGRLADC